MDLQDPLSEYDTCLTKLLAGNEYFKRQIGSSKFDFQWLMDFIERANASDSESSSDDSDDDEKALQASLGSIVDLWKKLVPAPSGPACRARESH